MNELVKVCDAVHCPYSQSSGCNRYTVSAHCHLAYSAPGVVRQGIQVRASQYWLYADDSYDLAETQRLQDEFLAHPDEIQRAAAIVRLQEKPYEVTWA